MAQIVTQGRGEVHRVADRARVHAAFTVRAKDRVAAVDALATRVARVQVLLGRDGVTVESRRLSVHDAFDGRRRSGTAATQRYSILVVDLDQLDDLIAELVTADPSSLDGPFWDLADRSAAFGEAQRLAVADARGTAQGYADALAARLGPLVRLEDQSPGGGRTVHIARALSSRSAAPAVAELSLLPEEISVLANCSATWDLMA
ncbi:MAG TPA: SIMPL domain-containing protein [Pseudonocardiaceae bacterium]|jgi:hypothetical protein